MEDIWSVYRRDFNPAQPLVYVDEPGGLLIRVTCRPGPAETGQPARHDNAYDRNGVCDLFIFFQPLGGKRDESGTGWGTKADWAVEIKELPEVRYRSAGNITLVMDNLNTHSGASLYEAFEAHETRRLLDRPDMDYTSTQASWFNEY